MGRPLNKKYFGNRNVGSTGTGDNNIGGEGIASISWSTLGSFMGNSNVAVITFPALPAPTLPNGVQATWTAQYEVESVTTGAGKTNLAVGDTFGIASIPGMIAKVTDLSGANAIFSVTTTGASRGNALALADIPQDTQTIALDKIAGSGTAATFIVDVLFRVKESTVTITEKGSGYTGAETFTFTKPGTTVGTVPAGTIVLTTDSGSFTNGSADSDNQENAIVVYADVDGNGAVVGDIVKQQSGRRYKVTTAAGTAYCKLVADGTPAQYEVYMVATDVDGGTYYVTKLTGHRATLTPITGVLFTEGQSTGWSFAAASGTTVQIENA